MIDISEIKDLWPFALFIGGTALNNERRHWKAKSRDLATNIRIDTVLKETNAATALNREFMRAALERIEKSQEITNADIKHLLERR